ncbi:hypothetical protein K1X84_10075 [bacterium]|nr:hypothetical protein [bacterium]
MDTTSPINLELSRDEALVLFDFLAKFDDAKGVYSCDEVEQAVLWILEGRLEALLVEIVKPEYRNLVIEAKKRLLNPL